MHAFQTNLIRRIQMAFSLTCSIVWICSDQYQRWISDPRSRKSLLHSEKFKKMYLEFCLLRKLWIAFVVHFIFNFSDLVHHVILMYGSRSVAVHRLLETAIYWSTNKLTIVTCTSMAIIFGWWCIMWVFLADL